MYLERGVVFRERNKKTKRQIISCPVYLYKTKRHLEEELVEIGLQSPHLQRELAGATSELAEGKREGVALVASEPHLQSGPLAPS